MASPDVDAIAMAKQLPADGSLLGSLPKGVDGHEEGGRTSRVRFETVVEGSRPASLMQGLREIWAFREVVWALAERNVRVKYKHAVLGVAWAALQPLAFLAIFTIIFARIAGPSPGNTPYPAFALSTLVPWMFLQTAVAFGGQGLLADGTLLKKVYFAREAPVLGAVLSSCVDFGIGLGLVMVLGPFLGAHLSWAMLLVVPLSLVLVVLASGITMALSALTVYYRDFRYAVPLFLQVWMFASPVAYPVTMVPERWRNIYVMANPAAGILDGFRRTLAEGRMPDPHLLAISVGSTAIVAWAGYALFKRLEAGFADAI